MLKRPPVNVNKPVKYKSKSLTGQYCVAPFNIISIETNGDVRLCGCARWMPSVVGNIFKNNINEILNSTIAQDIRQSIIDGTYQYCNELTCSVLNNGQLFNINQLSDDIKDQLNDSKKFQLPRQIYIAGDLTCNLSCPSCRTKVIKLSPDDLTYLEKLGSTLRENLFQQPTDQHIVITLSTSGELFASPFLLKFVSEISPIDFPNVQLDIQSNGLLCEKFWHRLGWLENSVVKITITIDAAKKDTYEILRRGGQWEKILDSMRWLQQKKKENNMLLHTRMVVQQSNYLEIEDFYNLSKSFDADFVEYSRITNWSTYTKSEFLDVDVGDPLHKNYNDLKLILNKVSKFEDVLIYGGF